MVDGHGNRTAGLPYQRVLVTGGNGFVGRHLVPALRGSMAAGSSVIVATQGHAGADEVTMDLTDAGSVWNAVGAVRPDAVVHLAAQSSVASSSIAAAATWQVNLVGSMVLAQAVASVSPSSNFFFSSSAEVYGATFNDEIASETSPLRPRSPYARSKAAAEAMLADVLPATCRLIVARSANHSGAGQAPTFVLPAFAEQIAAAERRGHGMIEVGDLDAQRDFLAVDDVVGAYLVLLGHAASLPQRSVFNVASGRSSRIGDLLDDMLALSSVDVTVRSDPDRMRPSEVPAARLHNAALTALGWAPRASTRDVIRQVLDDKRQAAGGHGPEPTPRLRNA